MRQEKAFTLIELLVVISIIALLMAILLPTLQRINKQAKAVTCQANLKQWGTMLALYTEDYEGRFPSSISASRLFLHGPFRSEDDPNERRFESLNPVDTTGITCCPMAVRRSSDIRSRGSTFKVWEIDDFSSPFRGSYGFNIWMGTSGGKKAFSVKGRANVPVLLDCKRPEGFAKDYLGPPPLEGTFLDWGAFCMNRHNGYTNGLFLDWSVRKIGLKELWTLKWKMHFDTSNEWTKAGGVQPEDWPQWMHGFKDY